MWERGWEFTTLNHVLLLSSLKTSCLPNLPCPTIDQTCHQSEKTEASHTDTDETKDRGLGCMWYADDKVDWSSRHGRGGKLCPSKSLGTPFYDKVRGKKTTSHCAKMLSCQLLWCPFVIVVFITVPDSLGVV